MAACASFASGAWEGKRCKQSCAHFACMTAETSHSANNPTVTGSRVEPS